MKKIKSLSLLLSLILLMQCCLIPAAAAESAETLPAESTPAVTVAAPEELTFGTVSIKNGCRTIALGHHRDDAELHHFRRIHRDA